MLTLKFNQEKEKKSLKHSGDHLYKIELVLPKHPPGCTENESMQTKPRNEEKRKSKTKLESWHDIEKVLHLLNLTILMEHVVFMFWLFM